MTNQPNKRTTDNSGADCGRSAEESMDSTAPPATPPPPPAPASGPPEPEKNDLDLYKLLVDQIQKYSTIVWQFPTALFAANTLAVDKFLKSPQLLLALAIADVALVFAFQRLVSHQRTVIDAARKAEAILRQTKVAALIPDFRAPTIRATTVTLIALWAMTGALAIYAAAQLLVTYGCVCCHQ